MLRRSCLSLGLPQFIDKRVRSADLLIAIGTRLGDVTTNGYALLEPPGISPNDWFISMPTQMN